MNMTTTAPGAHDELQRGLSNRHLQLIAIGGAIGTGLFLGSGKVISLTGPSVLFIYAVIGCMMFLLMRALGELLLSNLNYKTFGDIAKDLIGPWAGYFVSWTYWVTWVVICVADIIAITSYVSYINASIPNWVPAAITVAVLTILNLQPVRFFGEFEFWFSLIKIVAILALIATGVVLLVMGFENPDTGTRAELSHLWDHGGMFPFGASGFLLGFQLGIFSFIGVELVGTAAAETKDPHRNLPRAINSIVVRVLIFYIGALTVIMAITPWDKLDPDQSPFVTTFAYAGFGAAAFAINIVVLTSAASSANSGFYSGTRMMHSLARDGHAPQGFALTDSRGVPRKAVFFSTVFVSSSVPILLLGDSVIEAFTFVTSVASTFILFTWSMIAISFIQYMRKHPERHRTSAFRTPFARIVPWIVLAFFAFILVTLFLADDTRLPLMFTPLWFIALAVMWQATKRKLIRDGRPLTAAVDLPDVGAH
ncbi:D-serine/D-alanine/glycine:proton symporter (AAT family) [Leucobacter luti]|uniref:D-serine/D-alanine/glycine:proton symporter (AAT family) n=2 Tax=Leucobacter luti TaxID=340320 RepID=A0A4V3CXT7_9MICO|nr:D-serine/D-alanine/glycine:proton symporter (AAT family) [Leucobacter luti]TDP91558.1 D-serine/D-alanine/glycine:proton symporter (AAT family) [Leucobacter luti]